MSDKTGGIGSSSPTPEVPMLGNLAGVPKENVEALLHTPISNLGQLKAVLIRYLGQKEGEKAYNSFMTSFAMIMMQEVQHSAQQAQKASQNMRANLS